MTKTSTRHTLSHRADDLESETAARRRNVKIIAPLVPPALKHLFVGSDIRKSDSHRISCLRATGREGFWAACNRIPEVSCFQWLTSSNAVYRLRRAFAKTSAIILTAGCWRSS